jgi:hypothetical protein
MLLLFSLANVGGPAASKGMAGVGYFFWRTPKISVDFLAMFRKSENRMGNRVRLR